MERDQTAESIRDLDLARRLTSWWTDWTDQSEDGDIPFAPPSLPAAGKLLADEALLWSRGVVRPSSRSAMQGAQREIAAATELYERAGWLEDPTGFHPAPPNARPRFEKAWGPAGAYEHMTFESGYVPEPEDPARSRWLGYRDNCEGHAWVLRNPEDSGRWLVCVPGLGMGSALSDLAAFEAARLRREYGLNVLVYVPPLHGPRRRGWRSGEGLFDPSPLQFVHFATQAVWDLRRILGWIRSHGGTRIGAFGLSMGATPVSLLANLEPGLACVIGGIPSVDPRHHIAPFCDYVEEHTGEDAASVRARIEHLYRVVSPYAAPVLVSRSRRYLFAGVLDRVITPERVKRLWSHWGEAEIAWYPGSHVSFGSEPEVRRFVEQAYARSGLIEAPGASTARSWWPWSDA